MKTILVIGGTGMLGQTVARQLKKVVIPALDTLFLGKETAIGQYDEICTQCGTCILGETG